MEEKLPKFDSFHLRDKNPHSGKVKIRKLFTPNSAMREVHAYIINKIRSANIPTPSARGGGVGDSAVHNVLAHRKSDGSFRRHFFLTDLAAAYKNVVLSSALVRMQDEYPHVFTQEFNQLVLMNCTLPHEGLVTGGPASVDLFNLYLEYMVDRELRVFAEEHALVYTRYLDDLTFSSDNVIGIRQRKMIFEIIRHGECLVNHRKTQVLDLTKHSVEINGIGIHISGKMFIPGRVLRSYEALLYRAFTKGDVTPEEVHGKIGTFRYLMKSNALDSNKNGTEEKICRLYGIYKRRLA